MRPGWRDLRAAFVVFHLCAILVAGMPSTDSALRRSTWKDPTVQAELTVWADRFRMDQDAFEDRLYDFASAWAKGRALLETPFSGYLALTATDQSWQMFVAPHLYPTRFEIAVRRGSGDWETVFEERSTTATWRAGAFGTERLRASIFRWGWGAYATAYHTACDTFAHELFAEDPDTVRVRCRFWKARSPSPAEARDGVAPVGKYVYPWEVGR